MYPLLQYRFFTAIIGLIFWISGPINGQITADFTAFTTGGCAPLLVQFSDLSTGNITGWNWDFGNGATSTQTNPSIVYTNPGVYTVVLTVTAGTSSATETKAGYITVSAPPAINFTGQPLTGCAPHAVSFTDQSTFSAPASSFVWSFGDGSTSPTASPTHTYASAGNYSVGLSIVDANGCFASRTIANLVQVVPIPRAEFSTSDSLGCRPPHSVSFVNSSTGSNLSYQWSFGDGTTATQAAPSHTYALPGSYTVELIVTSSAGCSDTLVRTNYVRVAPLNANLSTPMSRVCVGEPVLFFDQSTGTPIIWQWDFGDGGTDTVQNPIHTFSTPGQFSITLIVSDGSCTDTIQQSSTIEVVAAPTADFQADTLRSCRAPFTVSFTDLSTGALAWSWDFGDGTTSTANNPSHTYTAPGQYTVRLAVANADSCRDTLFRAAYIEILPPVADFVLAGPASGCLPLLVNFVDSSRTALGNVTAWNWDFGDGSSANTQNPSHTYTTAGTFTVTLIATTDSACADTLVVPNLITTGTPPTANFPNTPMTTCYGDTASFTNLSTNATTYTWNFGDTITSGSVNPIHVYALPGCYDVSLIANNNGCRDTILRPSYVCVQGARADFTWSPVAVCDTPATFTFNSIPNTPSLKWQWTLGDGTFASGPSVTHTYLQTGSYVVTMFVEDTISNCTDTITRTYRVERPVAGYTLDTLAGCLPLTVNFTDTTTDATTWSWDFGDGGTDTLANPSHLYTAAGTYDVTLVARFENGCSDTLIVPAQVNAYDVNANFSLATQLLCQGTPYSFNDLSTSNSSVTTWTWSFGDGNGSLLQNPQHTYTAGGIYPVGLAVTDANGCTDTLTRTGYVAVFDPVAAFSLSDTLLCPGDPLQITNQSSPNGSTFFYDFGDGNNSTLASPQHIYTSPGNYPITLVFTDSAGCSDTAVRNLTIARPAAAFAVSDSVRNCPPLLVQFSDLSFGNIVAWQWDFGDGATSQLPNPSHLYSQAGRFDVTLIVTTATGCSDTLVFPERIDVAGPNANLAVDRDSICTGETINLSATNVNTSSLTWVLGDGTLVRDSVALSHTYLSSGAFLPTVLIQDSLGCSLLVALTDSIRVIPGPSPAIAADRVERCDPGVVQFSDSTQYISPAATWNWNFGDGNTASVPNPTHTYSAPGTYDVSLAVTDSLGCPATQQLPGYIRIYAQTANFSLLPSTGCVPLTVDFTDNSTADTTIASWQWAFGDGDNGSGSTAQHVYLDTTAYAVRLIITTAAGCRDTLIVPRAVQGYLPNNQNPPEMVVATVENDVRIAVNWNPNLFTGAANLRLERSLDGSTWANLATLPPGSNQYADPNVDVQANRYSYRILQEDSCGGVSPVSRPARSILAQVDARAGRSELSWSAYLNWAAGIDRYAIESRDDPAANWQVLATVPGTQLNYTDATLSATNTERCYRIRAYELNGNLSNSLSNSVCARGEIWVPNMITPNNDGTNDALEIPGLAAYPGSQIEIFGRWGGLVFSSNDYQGTWNGVHQSTGESLPDGTYYYVLTLGGTGQVLKGYTTIMR
ncbi:MAG: PKD domain-containing protein [Bacteroidota bacterium]